MEKRKYHKRLAVATRVKVYRIDKRSSHILSVYLLETKDMTQKGLFLKTKKTFPIHTQVRLELTLLPDSPPINVEGKVAWLAKRSQVGYYPGMGIEITKIKRGEARLIKNFLKQKFLNYRHAVELKKMYLQLKDMEARLYDMEQHHNHAEHFRKVIDRAIKRIDYIAHILDREVWEVKSL
ncbi:MAG: PilZ domain-containing protein [Candidatus Omnitrophica bacterium]|nr:PilZ domain-containing protein [Candidatus Omnitrophota bacterium]